jgi:hypothetical protein
MAAGIVVTAAARSAARPGTGTGTRAGTGRGTGSGTRSRAGDRASAAQVAARTAPRGSGLAPVIALPGGAATEDAGPIRPPLRVVPPHRPRSASRRAALVRAASTIVAVALVVGFAAAASSALLDRADAPAVAGHVVLQPGETLWDVAVRSAPAGVDPRRQLDVLRRLNGFGPGALDAWTVVLIPAP